MEIQKKCNHPAFTAKFVPNKAFKDVVKYAEGNGYLRQLDTALNAIKNIDGEDILLIHGKNNGYCFSNLTMGKRTVYNAAKTSPEESSFFGILELGTLEKKKKKLLGCEIKENITAESIMKNYTTDIKI